MTTKKKRIECKDWFRTNHYEDVVTLIEQAEAKVTARGSKQRRNWWEVLAGGINGKPSVREGIEFPVLRAAQIHQGKEITPNAICRNLNEQPPSAWRTARWPQRKKT